VIGRAFLLVAALCASLAPASAEEPASSPDIHPAVITVSKAGDALGAPIALRPTTVIAPDASGIAPTIGGRPLASMALTSRFGMRSHPILGGVRMHSGVDLAAPAGSPVYATATGVVSFANWSGGYGLLVVVDHGGQLQTRFGHLSRLMVSPGQTVVQGQVLGLVGSTGRSTGPHLHYEVRRGGLAVNPLARR
jgi:murein DD-endopeptidase MepM/ murein hydrolase activator NlpD